MAMTEKGLTDAIYSALSQPFLQPGFPEIAKQAWLGISRQQADALGPAIVRYLQQNATAGGDPVE